MKKILFMAVAAVAMIGMASCSGKDKNVTDTASVSNDSDSVIVTDQVVDQVNVDSINKDSALVTVTQEQVETVTPVKK